MGCEKISSMGLKAALVVVSLIVVMAIGGSHGRPNHMVETDMRESRVGPRMLGKLGPEELAGAGPQDQKKGPEVGPGNKGLPAKGGGDGPAPKRGGDEQPSRPVGHHESKGPGAQGEVQHGHKEEGPAGTGPGPAKGKETPISKGPAGGDHGAGTKPGNNGNKLPAPGKKSPAGGDGPVKKGGDGQQNHDHHDIEKGPDPEGKVQHGGHKEEGPRGPAKGKDTPISKGPGGDHEPGTKLPGNKPAPAGKTSPGDDDAGGDPKTAGSGPPKHPGPQPHA